MTSEQPWVEYGERAIRVLEGADGGTARILRAIDRGIKRSMAARQENSRA